MYPMAMSLLLGVPELLTYDVWTTTFAHSYSNRSQEHRRAAFEANVEFIRAHNKKADAGLSSFRCGVNSMSDLSREEYRALLGLREEYRSSAAENVAPISESVPASVDWRSKGAVTPVKNQGSCGACWAFSTTGSLEGAYAIATGALRSLSEQQLMDCSFAEGNQGCNGGSMDAAFSYVLANGGLDSESEYGYLAASDEPCWSAAEARHVASLAGYQDVAKSSEPALLSAIAIGRPRTATHSHAQPRTATHSHAQPRTATHSHAQPEHAYTVLRDPPRLCRPRLSRDRGGPACLSELQVWHF
jgi:hypothetical protein